MKNKLILISLFAFYSCDESKTNSQGESFSENVNKVEQSLNDESDLLQFFNNETHPIKPKFTSFKSGSVVPKGWILEMMKTDLEEGIVGALDELYPGIKSDDLYNKARRGGMEDIPEMGDLVLTGEPWEKSIMWWNAETIGNWWDGFIRHAFLTQNPQAMDQSHQIINNLLASQDPDGYIGIYKPNLRYQHDGSNGELWAQTTAFRSMLAYYEFTNKVEVLKAVEKGMAMTMERYGEDGRNPFYLKNAFGGVTHGLMLTDVCETLYRITGKIEYQEYATYLYKAFSTYSINRAFNDLRYPFLIEKDSLFEGHGVHTYEHIRTLVNALYHTGYPELELAYNHMLYKLDLCVLPSGAGHGDEWILGLEADATQTASEYCTMLELRNSYGSLIEKTGQVQFADAAEKLTYNGMLGARNRDGTAITYSKHDNCYSLDGKHHSEGKSTHEPRYKYSPTHSEPAVCCVPNYGRNLPYFLSQMYMKADQGIAVLMYGPSKLSTQMDGNEVSIEQRTMYPFSEEIKFIINTEKPVEFSLILRKPQWSESLGFSLKDEFIAFKDDHFTITKKWLPDETFTITFKNPVELKKSNEEIYVQQGPIVFAYPIPHKEETIKAYDHSSFRDYYCIATNQEYQNLAIDDPSSFRVTGGRISDDIYDSDLILKGTFYDNSKQKKIDLDLVPMGTTVLRRVTFPKIPNI